MSSWSYYALQAQLHLPKAKLQATAAAGAPIPAVTLPNTRPTDVWHVTTPTAQAA